ncbi:MAG: hypothetical protein RBU27_05445 [Bacteroidota bacterium]|jgi:hypothetical protein|nr:hypothetical protein [Bacteroidota bacterium]
MNKILVALVAVVALALGLYFFEGTEENREPAQPEISDAEIMGTIDWDATAQDTSNVFELCTCQSCGELAAIFTYSKVPRYPPDWYVFCLNCGAGGGYMGSVIQSTPETYINMSAPHMESLDSIRVYLRDTYLNTRNPIAVDLAYRARERRD